MAALTIHLYSEVLKREETVTAVYPTTVRQGAYSEFVLEPGIRYQTLWLLNEEDQDETAWLRFSQIEDYADEAKIIVVMPAVRDYADADQEDTIRFLSEELPEKLGGMLPLSMERRDNYIAGPSEGAVLACRICACYPEKYGAAGLFSGDFSPDCGLTGVMEQCRAAGRDLPEIWLCAGAEDKVFSANLEFLKWLRSSGWKYTWTEGPGNHDYRYWDARVKDFISWNPLIGGAPLHPVR